MKERATGIMEPSVPVLDRARELNGYLTQVRGLLNPDSGSDWWITASQFGDLAEVFKLGLGSRLVINLERGLRNCREGGVITHKNESLAARRGIIVFKYSIDEVLAFAAICWVIGKKKQEGDGYLNVPWRDIVRETKELLGKSDPLNLNQYIVPAEAIPVSARLVIGKPKTRMVPRSDGKNGGLPDQATKKSVELGSLTLERLRILDKGLRGTPNIVNFGTIKEQMGIDPDQARAIIDLAIRLGVFTEKVDLDEINLLGFKTMVQVVIRRMENNSIENLQELRIRLDNMKSVFPGAARNGRGG